MRALMLVAMVVAQNATARLNTPAPYAEFSAADVVIKVPDSPLRPSDRKVEFRSAKGKLTAAVGPLNEARFDYLKAYAALFSDTAGARSDLEVSIDGSGFQQVPGLNAIIRMWNADQVREGRARQMLEDQAAAQREQEQQRNRQGLRSRTELEAILGNADFQRKDIPRQDSTLLTYRHSIVNDLQVDLQGSPEDLRGL